MKAPRKLGTALALTLATTALCTSGFALNPVPDLNGKTFHREFVKDNRDTVFQHNGSGDLEITFQQNGSQITGVSETPNFYDTFTAAGTEMFLVAR